MFCMHMKFFFVCRGLNFNPQTRTQDFDLLAMLKEESILRECDVCNNVNPDFIRLRTLVVQHGSLLEKSMINGLYQTSSPIEKIKEVKILISNLKVKNCKLASDHLTNN